jgi:calcineurin-like phosphoesterase family protein
MFNQLPGAERHLIVGNHDHEPTLDLPWTSVSHFSELRDGPQNQLNTLCHYPMITWNHARKGALQLFGRVHNNWHGSRNSVNVGVDVWDFVPVTFDKIVRRAKKLPPNKHWGDVEHGAELSP